MDIVTIEIENVSEEKDRFSFIQKCLNIKNKLFNTTSGKLFVVAITIISGMITRIIILTTSNKSFYQIVC